MIALPPNPDRIINDEWAKEPDGNWYTFARRHAKLVNALNQFILFMEQKAYAPHSVDSYFIRVRAAFSKMLDEGGDLFEYVQATPHESEAKIRQQALGAWAEFVGPEGKHLAETLKEWRKGLSKQYGPKGGRKPRHDREGLDEDVFVALRSLAFADPDVRGIVLSIMMITPLRVGDVLRITRQQVEDGRRIGKMRLRLKGNNLVDNYPARPLDTQLRQLLEQEDQWLRVQDLLGGTYSAASKRVVRRLQRYGRKIGYAGDLHLHLLRHSVLTRIADDEQAGGLRVASSLAGHASLTTTANIYLKKAPPFERQEEALMRGMVR